MAHVPLPDVQFMFNLLYPPSTRFNILNGDIKRSPTSPAIFYSRYAALYPGGNKLFEALSLWNSMTDDEKQPWKELAVQFKELHTATFLPQLRAAWRKATVGHGPRSDEVCETYCLLSLLSTRLFILVT